MTLSTKPSPRHSPIVRSVVFLGDMSYDLYCTHLLTFSLVAWTVTNHAINPFGHTWAYMGAMLTAGLVVGAATYLTFEKPTTNFLKRLIKRPRPLAGR
jgi:peptidoglycan/LPS O-acetylase OafA/YrhL